MAARIIEICDDVVTFLTGNWTDQPAPTIERVYVPEFSTIDFTGPKVFVFPAAYNQVEATTRKRDKNAFRVSVLFVQKYTAAGLPTTAWLDDLVALVEEEIYGPLGDHRAEPLGRAMWPETAEINTVYDLEFLHATNLFISECEFEFREVS